MKVQAAILKKYGDPLELVELELRKPQAGEILVKLRATGICHSDLSTTTGALPFPVPIVLGHEGTLNSYYYYLDALLPIVSYRLRSFFRY
jgi:Zn-dependent alcohol dehydrogenase